MKYFTRLIVSSFIIFALLDSCKPDGSYALVTTSVISSITKTSAVSGGNVITDGGDAVTDRGVCWSTNMDPNITEAKSSDGSGTGIFKSNLTDLQPGTIYHVRAYASNPQGTVYGEDISFTTLQ